MFFNFPYKLFRILPALELLLSELSKEIKSPLSFTFDSVNMGWTVFRRWPLGLESTESFLNCLMVIDLGLTVDKCGIGRLGRVDRSAIVIFF